MLLIRYYIEYALIIQKLEEWMELSHVLKDMEEEVGGSE
jgi:hypothetical protein